MQPTIKLSSKILLYSLNTTWSAPIAELNSANTPYCQRISKVSPSRWLASGKQFCEIGALPSQFRNLHGSTVVRLLPSPPPFKFGHYLPTGCFRRQLIPLAMRGYSSVSDCFSILKSVTILLQAVFVFFSVLWHQFCYPSSKIFSSLHSMPRLWTAQEADCLLNHIERHKGPEGKWIKNFSEAVEEVQLQLRSIKPSGVASLSKESIRWKIRTISNRVSERGRAQPQTLLFSKGPVVLKLRDKIYVGRGRTPASTVAGQQATEMSGRPPLRNAATSAKNQNQHANDRGNEPDQLDDDIADTTSLYMPDGTNLSLIHELCGTKGRPQKPISGNAISTNTQTQEWTNPIPDCLEQSTCSGHGIRRQSDQLATTLAVADAFPVQCHYRSINAMPNGLQEAAACQDHIPEVPVLEEWEKQILETFRKSFDVTGRAEPQAHTDVRSDMDNLYRQIRECMEGLEQSGDRRTIQYLPLSSDGVFLELGQLLFHGKQPIELIDKLSLVHGTYAVPLMDILRSLAAAALTWWPLNYFAECREQWTDHFRGPLERKMLQGMKIFPNKRW